MPTKTTSPSCNCRAAWQTINSFAVPILPGSIAVVDGRTQTSARLQTGERCSHALDILGAITHAVHPFVQIRIESHNVFGNLSPADIEPIVTVIIALRIRRMAAERFAHDSLNY